MREPLCPATHPIGKWGFAQTFLQRWNTPAKIFHNVLFSNQARRHWTVVRSAPQRYAKDLLGQKDAEAVVQHQAMPAIRDVGFGLVEKLVQRQNGNA